MEKKYPNKIVAKTVITEDFYMDAYWLLMGGASEAEVEESLQKKLEICLKTTDFVGHAALILRVSANSSKIHVPTIKRLLRSELKAALKCAVLRKISHEEAVVKDLEQARRSRVLPLEFMSLPKIVQKTLREKLVACERSENRRDKNKRIRIYAKSLGLNSDSIKELHDMVRDADAIMAETL